ncbi:sensor histidine kinase [Dactylosporangium sp. CS-047395]|uniref:sensor histidine kinase n=1 Tax=Dactylosporangium sp. CS-047395 TaxID=3239936 RepID=UPI003D94945F
MDIALYALVAVLFALSSAVVSWPLAIAQLVPLVLRRRYPGTAVMLIAGATAAHSLLGMARAVGYLPVALAVYFAATQRSRWVRFGACGGAFVLVTVAGAVRHGPIEGGLLAAVALIVTWLAGFERGELLRERAAAETARSRERLARQLHDSLAHTMTVMLVQGEALRATAQLSPTDAERLQVVLQAGRDALAEVRRALAGETPADVTEMLDGRLAGLRAAGLDVRTVDGLDALPEIAHRLVGEAATNALRHDGPGATVDITVRENGTASTLSVTSRPAEEDGFGLRSLAADVAAAGGTLTYGWQVTAVFPHQG